MSDLVVSRVPVARPRLVLDLGAGDGALSEAASRRWRNSQVIAVESDRTRCGTLLNRGVVGAVHANALGTDWAADLGLRFGSVSTAVCNPPFIRPKWRKHFGEILEDAHFSGCYPTIEEAGAAVLFLAQNLRFLRKGGHLALIIPDGLISGIKHRALRQVLRARYRVIETIELPTGTFCNTEVKTHALVVRNSQGGNAEVAMRTFAAGGLSEPIVLRETVLDRLDYSYYRVGPGGDLARPRQGTALAGLAQLIERGRLSSAQRYTLVPGALHTTDLSEDGVVDGRRLKWPARKAESPDHVYARTGDILVARVGRRLHEKVAVLKNGPVAITDCVYRIVISDETRRDAVLRFLRSTRGRDLLAGSASGTGARHLSKAELGSIVVPGVFGVSQ